MPQDSASSRILTLVFTDLVESTALKVTQGDVPAGELIARHRSHLVRIGAFRESLEQAGTIGLEDGRRATCSVAF